MPRQRREPVDGGPFHDTFPSPARRRAGFHVDAVPARFLCWRPQGIVLFSMDAGGGINPPALPRQLSEWTPSLMRDGRILWMRSVYLDKGADFGHTLWAIRPGGAPGLIFGNTRSTVMPRLQCTGDRRVLLHPGFPRRRT